MLNNQITYFYFFSVGSSILSSTSNGTNSSSSINSSSSSNSNGTSNNNKGEGSNQKKQQTSSKNKKKNNINSGIEEGKGYLSNTIIQFCILLVLFDTRVQVLTSNLFLSENQKTEIQLRLQIKKMFIENQIPIKYSQAVLKPLDQIGPIKTINTEIWILNRNTEMTDQMLLEK